VLLAFHFSSENGNADMSHDDHYQKLERMYAGAPCNDYYAPVMRVSKARAEIVIQIQEKFFHSAGATHGSVYFKALDDAAFFATNSLVRDALVLTVSFQTYLTRPISGGEMRAIGSVVHGSKNLLIAESVLSDAKGREIGRGSGSFVKSKVRLTPEIGYQ